MILVLEILLTCLLVLALLELTGWKHYIARGADYLQLQLAVVMGLLAMVHLVLSDVPSGFDVSLYVLSGYFVLRAAYRLFPYTPLASKEVASAKAGNSDVSILVVNLKYDNDQYRKAQDVFDNQKQDIVVLVEATPEWEKALERFISNYPYYKKIIRDDPWGMIVLSKWEIVDERELRIYNDTPTLALTLAHEDREIDLCVLHPKPPFPIDTETSIPKDVELAKMGKLIDGQEKPTIVAGDLNDVAWSRPTRKFLKAAKLKDPRKGRGIYGSFPTYAPIMSFPLDQIFVSEHFELVSFRKLKHIGSDHFPIHASFSMGPIR